MKQQITIHLIYPSGTEHIVQVNKIEEFSHLFTQTNYCHGYIVDSETLEIGTDVCFNYDKLINYGLLKDEVICLSNYKVKEILFDEKFLNWFDKIIKVNNK